MAANDDFPRGWTKLSAAAAAGTVPQVVLPAVPGVAHVLTQVDCTLEGQAAHTAFGPTVQLFAPAFILVIPIFLLLPGTATFEKDSDTWSGKYAGPVGAGMSIQLQVAMIAGTIGIVGAQGYDI